MRQRERDLRWKICAFKNKFYYITFFDRIKHIPFFSLNFHAYAHHTYTHIHILNNLCKLVILRLQFRMIASVSLNERIRRDCKIVVVLVSDVGVFKDHTIVSRAQEIFISHTARFLHKMRSVMGYWRPSVTNWQCFIMVIS
jgi:hypothetical protein